MLFFVKREEVIVFFNLINILYEKIFIIIIINKVFIEWVEILNDEIFVSVLFDRLFY